VIALIGLPGAGKSTVAPLLAERLGCAWSDLDAEIGRAEGRPVPELLRGLGEPAFRAIEARALGAALEVAERAAAGPTGARGVVACGGGVLALPESRARLRRHAFVVWLEASPAAAADRLGAGGAGDRPLLAGEAGLAARIAALDAERRALYGAAADAVVPTDGRAPLEVAEEIRRAWEARWGSSAS